MTIKVGDKIPDATLSIMGEKGPQATATADLFKGKTVAVFAVPGAFTPTCSAKHVPGFVEHAEDIKAKGVDQIVCLSVNDAFVMNAWGKDQNVGSKIVMAADGNGELTKKLGLEMDGSKFGLGSRSQRYSMIVKDGVVEKLNVEEPGAFAVSNAETLLGQL
ncbi:Hybrid peroxiredoxin hyPrx5 [Alphaproteobacteria bacterium SO-S41]|nr:Hybrid peroxiredoxin hyPrx5 [Alphaproteobacteria bacterium SO-S41]